MVFGDYVDQHPRWAAFKKIDTEYANAIKAAGGTVDWINLPEIGIKGNGHMMMQDKNNMAGRRGDPEVAGRQGLGRVRPTLTHPVGLLYAMQRRFPAGKVTCMNDCANPLGSQSVLAAYPCARIWPWQAVRSRLKVARTRVEGYNRS